LDAGGNFPLTLWTAVLLWGARFPSFDASLDGSLAPRLNYSFRIIYQDAASLAGEVKWDRANEEIITIDSGYLYFALCNPIKERHIRLFFNFVFGVGEEPTTFSLKASPTPNAQEFWLRSAQWQLVSHQKLYRQLGSYYGFQER
jgi:hypothetical protein